MRPGSRLRPALAGAATLTLGALLTAVPATAYDAPDARTTPVSPRVVAAAADDPGYSSTRTLTRVITDADGTERTVSSHEVTVRVDQTENLRGRQRVRVSWSGARPSAGRASNPFGENGLLQEYPVVVMQCRGVDDPTGPRAPLTPETCWTASVAQRSQTLRSAGESVWTHDLHEDAADKQRVSGLDPLPAACADTDVPSYFTHLTEFTGADGTVYPACSADTMPPEAAVGAAFPAAEISAFTDVEGNGSVQFELRSEIENESLGCSDTVQCSIVVIPIVGLSCDKPAQPPTSSDKGCRKAGRFKAGESNFANEGVDQAVSPALWWAESNWRNRFSVPITFGLPPDACDVLDTRAPTGFYGSELLAQAALQWSPAYCLDAKRFKFQLNRVSDIAAWTLMQNGEAPAAEVSSVHEPIAPEPVGYAPTAVTGFSVGYVVDRPGNAGEVTELRLNARLLVKLLSQSYLGSDLGRGHPGMGGNPLSIMSDKEFTDLNRDLSTNDQEAAATILSLSESSDIIEQLTAYIASDADAMAFVGGEPDPNGMVINPAYQDIELPRPEWPLLDSYIPTTSNKCREANPTVYFTSVAAPVTTLRKISDALLDAWPNVQTRCDYDPSTDQYKIGRIDRQSYGARFMIGITSLGDAARFGLRSAALETSPGEYVAPSDASLTKAVTLATQRTERAPFVLDQARVRAAGDAYPGTMIVYTAAKLQGLEQESADKVAQFIRVSTTEGQRPGSGNGQLPAGYLPIRTTGPTAKLFRSAVDVADAVQAQEVPPGEEETADPDPTDGPTTDAPDTTGPGSTDLPSTDDDAGTVPDATAPGGDEPPTAAPTGAADAADPDVGDASLAPTSATLGADSGLAAKLLPLLVVLALLGAGYSAASRFFVRPPRPGR